MSLFIEAQLRSDFVDLPLSALREVLQSLNEIEPLSELEESSLRARKIYEAAASFLDWDADHKFASSWLGDTPRRESSSVDETKQTLLAAAVVVGSLSTVQKLLEDPSIDVNYESPFLGALLQLAARRGDAEILNLPSRPWSEPMYYPSTIRSFQSSRILQGQWILGVLESSRKCASGSFSCWTA